MDFCYQFQRSNSSPSFTPVYMAQTTQPKHIPNSSMHNTAGGPRISKLNRQPTANTPADNGTILVWKLWNRRSTFVASKTGISFDSPTCKYHVSYPADSEIWRSFSKFANYLRRELTCLLKMQAKYSTEERK